MGSSPDTDFDASMGNSQKANDLSSRGAFPSDQMSLSDASTENTLTLRSRLAGDKAKNEQAVSVETPKKSRRGLFGQSMAEIHTDLMRGEMRSSSFQPTSSDEFEKYKKNHLTGGKAATARNQTATSCCPGRSTKRSRAKIYSEPPEWRGLQSLAQEMLVDDGLSPISAVDYIQFRVLPTMEYYAKTARVVEKKVGILQIAIFFGTFLNAVLSFVDETPWIPVVLTFVAAVGAIMDYEMYSTRLGAANAAQMSLQNLVGWWESLSLVERRLNESKTYLVETTETAVYAELSWAMSITRKKKPETSGEPKNSKDGPEN